MIRKTLSIIILWAIISAGCLGVQGCAQTGKPSMLDQALIGAAVGVVVTEQCLEQGINALWRSATYALGGFSGGEHQAFNLHAVDRFKCPSDGKVVLTLHHDSGLSYEVTLMKQGRAYTGPKGEYYPALPSDEQLRLRYGH